MRVYQFYFISPSIRDNFPRQITRKCEDDCKAIVWALSEYATGGVENIALYDDDDARKIKILLSR